jgi:hypothetical protein
MLVTTTFYAVGEAKIRITFKLSETHPLHFVLSLRVTNQSILSQSILTISS